MTLQTLDTIAAVATPRGAGGIAIVKISGPLALTIRQRIFRPAKTTRGKNPTDDSHRMAYGHIVHPRDGVIDEVLVVVMRAPRSYTTEDLVEVHCHGGAMVTQAILELVLHQGARLAEPGEFTRRAFVGGRINLTQAEAVIDLINAKTRQAALTGVQQLDHGLDQQVESACRQLSDCLVEIEAHIDFDDDLEEPLTMAPLVQQIETRILKPLTRLADSYREGRILKEGVRIVVAGRPNVGKSSLVNLLLNQQRVIVTDIPGTTRDLVEEMIAIDGTPVVITDTAGIHASRDPIEALGIEKSEAAIANADLVIFMLDANQPIRNDDRRIYQRVKNRRHLVVRNKVDRGAVAFTPSDLALKAGQDVLPLSAKTGQGLDKLKSRLVQSLGVSMDTGESAVCTSVRQKRLLEKTCRHVRHAASLLQADRDSELAAIEIKDAIDSLQEILGRDVAPDVLDQIFNRFCIGK